MPELKTEYVKCRAYRHSWDDEIDRSLLPDNVRAIKGWIEAVRCDRCHCVRVGQLDWSGHLLHPYDYHYEDEEEYKTVTHLDSSEAKVILRKQKQAKERAAKNGNGKADHIEEVEERTSRRGSRRKDLASVG